MPEDYLTPATGNVRILAEPIIAKDLKPGDLFSMAGPEHWGVFDRDIPNFSGLLPVGEKVYIRTNAPVENAPDGDAIVYRITIIKE